MIVSNPEPADDTARHVSVDRLLGERVVLYQPVNGYRAAIDPAFLAASVSAGAGDSVLDAGCGTAAAALCLAARVPDVVVTGLELQPEMVQFAHENINANAMAARVNVMQGDVASPPQGILSRQFDHVMANPPYMVSHVGNPPLDPVKATAMVEGGAGIDVWVSFVASALRPKGTLTLVHRTERLSHILAAMEGRFGDIRVFPLWAGPGMDKPAKRLLIQARKGVKTPLSLLPGMILHQLDGSYTPEAEAVLRDAARVDMRADS
jgi:tRNA1(Val) A37 N6-methylase TrmN6